MNFNGRYSRSIILVAFLAVLAGGCRSPVAPETVSSSDADRWPGRNLPPADATISVVSAHGYSGTATFDQFRDTLAYTVDARFYAPDSKPDRPVYVAVGKCWVGGRELFLNTDLSYFFGTTGALDGQISSPFGSAVPFAVAGGQSGFPPLSDTLRAPHEIRILSPGHLEQHRRNAVAVVTWNADPTNDSVLISLLGNGYVTRAGEADLTVAERSWSRIVPDNGSYVLKLDDLPQFNRFDTIELTIERERIRTMGRDGKTFLLVTRTSDAHTVVMTD